jgi:hypothetical protein
MTGVVTVVDVQWALYGKGARASGDRVIACSAGDLATVNFADAISRFQLGALHSLPQVSVSYAQSVKSGSSYLALAIHKQAEQGQAALDEDGRPVTYTHYFCLPYGPLAAGGVTYQAMHEALRDLRLPAASGATLRVPIAGRPWPPPVTDLLALRVAALLLTGRSVCVRRAQHVPVAGRLGFIDTVMGLLPYGFRAKMTAATWTRATYRDHRFRLFFSDAPRGSERPDHVVSWDHPETAVITPEDGVAHEYLTWLQDTLIEPVARLTRLTEARGFGDTPVRNAVSLVTKPATRPASDAATRPATGSGAKPGAEPATRPGAEPGAKPGAKPGAEPATRPGAEPDAGPSTEPATGPATGPEPPPAARPQP